MCKYTYIRNNDGLRKDDVAVIINLSIELDWDLGFIDSFRKRFYNYIYPIYNIKYYKLYKNIEGERKNQMIDKPKEIKRVLYQ